MVQAEGEIAEFEIMGVQVLLCWSNHHRKLTILDRKNAQMIMDHYRRATISLNYY